MATFSARMHLSKEQRFLQISRDYRGFLEISGQWLIIARALAMFS